MNAKLHTWKLILKSLLSGNAVMLLYVVSSQGSSPGRQGFCMAINSNGQMEGSIGGGIMEHKFVEVARHMLSKGPTKEPLLQRQIHDKQAVDNRSGMICSGEQTLMLYEVKQDEINVVEQIIEAIETNATGTMSITAGTITYCSTPINQSFEFIKIDEKHWQYKERIGCLNVLHIIGGGHCALALSKVMALLDFKIRIYEDRADLYTMQLNTFVQQKILLKDYSKLSDLLAGGTNQYVVIMTFGYRTDDAVIRALYGKTFRYIGVLGSQSKIDTMLKGYMTENFDEAWVSRLHAPIGIDIKSETPEEIAISIAAEIIKVTKDDSRPIDVLQSCNTA